MAEQVLVVPNDEVDAAAGVPFIGTAAGGGDAGDVGGGFGVFLPLLLLASVLPLFGRVTTARTRSFGNILGCPVCTTPSPTVCTTPAPCSPVATCPANYIKLSGVGGAVVPNKCYAFLTSTQNFVASSRACAAGGGQLANVASTTEGQALRLYLAANNPTVPYYVGYTDLGNADNIVGLAGGLNPLPEFGTIQNTGNTIECVNIQATAAGTGSSDSPACTVTAKAICEVNLSAQRCICP